MKHHWFKGLALLLIIFGPRLLSLDRFLTADEPLFWQHAQAFAAGVSRGDFGQTLGIGYPGVTVAAWAAPWVAGQDEALATYAAGRFAVGLLNGLLVLTLVTLAGRLLGGPAAWTAGVLLALDPFLLGYSRLLHLEAVLATLMTLTGVALLLWLRDGRRLDLLLTGLFLGLALLTKSTALLLGPMLGLLLLGWAVTTGQWARLVWWRHQLLALGLAVIVAGLIFGLLWPAMWVDPIGTLKLTFGKLLVDQEAGAGNLGMFWLGRFVEDPGPLFYPVAFLLKATPWLLVGLALSLFSLVRVGKQGAGSREQEVGSREPGSIHNSQFSTRLALWLFAFTYLILMTLASKKAIRYLLPTFPVFYLLAGAALYQLYVGVGRGTWDVGRSAWGVVRRRFISRGRLVINNEQLVINNEQLTNPTLHPSNPPILQHSTLPTFQPPAKASFGTPPPSSPILQPSNPPTSQPPAKASFGTPLPSSPILQSSNPPTSQPPAKASFGTPPPSSPILQSSNPPTFQPPAKASFGTPPPSSPILQSSNPPTSQPPAKASFGTPPPSSPILQSSNPPTSQPPAKASFGTPPPSSPAFQSSILPSFLTLCLLAFTFIYHPYYLTYYNPALLGWRWAPQTILVGWGEGLDVAARSLNEQLPRQPQQTVAAWYEWLFPLMYEGQVEAVVPQENLLTAERVVLYLNQVQRDIPSPNLIHYFRSRRVPEQTIRLNGIDYAWIYPGPIVGSQAPATVEIPLGGEFGGELRLHGYHVSSPTPRSGEPLGVNFFWEVLVPPPADRFIFLRLVDAQGRTWARADSPPVLGLWPVERWQPGMFIEDAQELLIPAGTPPARYRLEVGVYDPVDGRPLAAVGQPLGPGGGLLLGEIDLEWQPRPALTADLPNRTAVQLSPAASLIGFDSLPARAVSGDLLRLSLAWREAGSWLNFGQLPADYVQLAWSRGGTVLAEQLEPLPLPVEQWGRGAVLRSQHELIVPPNLESGRYEVQVALHSGSDPAGVPFRLGTVEVTAPPHAFDLPAEALEPVGTSRLTAGDATVELAGYSVARHGDQLDLQLYWQTDRPLSVRYKIFVQLLTAEGGLVAQADAEPAAGQRPTTGWLPGEIITDGYRLTLPAEPPPPYRLITGLYDPRTGQRLPLLDSTGQPFPDAIYVSNEQ